MHLGPLAFSTSVIALLFGLVAALATAGFLRQRGLADASGALYWALVGGLVLGRLMFVLGWRHQYLEQPWSVLKLRDGGFDPVASVIGVVLTALIIGWRRPGLRTPLAAGVLVGMAACGLARLTAQQLRAATEQPLPTLTLRDLDGHEVALASLRGQPLVVNLWATWCGPCRNEMPMLVKARRELPAYRFVFIDQGEDAASVMPYARTLGLPPAQVLLDGTLDVSAHYGVRAYPTTLFVDANGILRDRAMGELSRATLEERLRRIAPAGKQASSPAP